MVKLLKELNDFSYDYEEIKKVDPKSTLTLTGVLQRADKINQNGRIYPRHVLEPQITAYSALVKERRALGELDHCLPGNYKILTVEGWKQLKDISHDEQVYTLNTETDEIQLETIKRKIEVPYSGIMYKVFNKRKLEMIISPNHKVLLWDRKNKPYKITGEQLYQNWLKKDSQQAHSYIRNTGIWNKEMDVATFTIPGTEYTMPIKTWAALFGFWLAEGHVTGSQGKPTKKKIYGIGITQKKNKNFSFIRKFIIESGMPWKETVRPDGLTHNWRISNKNIHAYFSQFGGSKQKFIPQEFLQNWDKETLSIMFDSMLIGDGRNRFCPVRKRILQEYSTISEKLAENCTEILFKLGRGSFIKKYSSSQDHQINNKLIKKENLETLYTTTENVTNMYMNDKYMSIEPINYSGYIYCVTTINGNFLAKSPQDTRPFWTGNCDEPVVNLKNVSHLITDIWMEPDGTVKGKVEVLKTPMGTILESLIRSNVKIGISSRALGSVDSQREGDFVKDDLFFICFDMVAEPSTNGAWMMKESRDYTREELKDILSRQQRVSMAASETLTFLSKIKNGK